MKFEQDQVNPYLPYLGQIKYTKVNKYLKNNDPAANDNAAIRWVSQNGLTEVVKLLLQDHRVNPTVRDNYAIIWASSYGHPEVVKLLLQDSRVDPAADGNYAIQWASENGHVEVVKLLLQDPRVDPTVTNNTAIRLASANGHTEVVKVLVDYFCGGDCLLSIDEIREIIKNTKDSEIDYVIARKNQGKIAEQYGLGDEDGLLDLF